LSRGSNRKGNKGVKEKLECGDMTVQDKPTVWEHGQTILRHIKAAQLQGLTGGHRDKPTVWEHGQTILRHIKAAQHP